MEYRDCLTGFISQTSDSGVAFKIKMSLFKPTLIIGPVKIQQTSMGIENREGSLFLIKESMTDPRV